MVTSVQTVTRDPVYSLLDGTSLGPGSSGAPLWIMQNGAPYVVGIVSTGSSAQVAYDALITNDILGIIQGWIAADHAGAAPPGNPVPVGRNIALSGRHDQYVISQTSDGQTYIRDRVLSRDGTRTLLNIQTVAFSDGTGVIDPSGNAEDVTRLYQAAFNRTPDLPGLTFNTGLVDANTVPLPAMADSFAGSPEFISRSGFLDDPGFVQQLYANVLHRLPDAGGQQNWVNALAHGYNRGAVLRGFADSTENRIDTLPIAGDRYDAAAYRMYQAALDRAPDTAGLANWSAQLSGGVPIDKVALGFTNSLEFMQKYGALNPADFVTRMYQNVLHREPDTPGRQGWIASMQNGTNDQAGVMVGFSESTENRINTAPATHDGWVFIG
jgi:hypothetical protein